MRLGRSRAAALRRLLGKRAHRLGWGLVDQAVSSLTNFAVVILAIRTVGSAQFGAFSLAYVTYGFVLSASRGLVTGPLQVRFSDTDLPAWRRAVLELLRLTLARHDGPVIAPGTLVNLDHFQEIIGGLRGDGAKVHHFALLAEPATVVRRLRARSLGREPRTQPWETEVLGEWLEQLHRPEFAEHVHTDHRTIAQVADVVSRSSGLTITPSTDGPVRSWLHRYATTARSIRWG